MEEDIGLGQYEETDLGLYIDILVRRWYLVLIPALVLALGTIGVLSQRPLRYEARALVAIARWTTQVSYGTALETISDDRGGSSAAATRISSFAELVESASVAQHVLSELHDRLPAERRTVLALLKSVQGENVAKSDLIAIKATAEDPELARDIANLWAGAYIREVNAIYGEVGKGALDAVRAGLSSAKADYARDQAALEDLLQEGTIEELKRDIQQRVAMIGEISNAQAGVINNLLRKQTDVIRKLLDSLLQTDMLLQAAHSLRHQAQVADDAGVASSNQALALLKVQAFGGIEARQQPFTLQVDLGSAPVTKAELLRDLNGLIAALERQQEELENRLDDALAIVSEGGQWDVHVLEAANDSSTSRSSQMRDSLERQVRELSTELERQESLLREARAQRDLSWQTYDNLVRKEAELALELATAGQFVRLGAPAVAQPVSAGLLRPTMTNALAGLMLGVFVALSLEWWKGYRLRSVGQTGAARLSNPDD